MLSRLLNSLVGQWGFVPFKTPPGCPVVFHLAYADDVIIFLSGLKKSLQLIMKVLKDYEKISGQKVNHTKSYFLAHASLLGVRRRIVTQITGFHAQSFPVKYLGCPLYSGR